VYHFVNDFCPAGLSGGLKGKASVKYVAHTGQGIKVLLCSLLRRDLLKTSWIMRNSDLQSLCHTSRHIFMPKILIDNVPGMKLELTVVTV
jgi:hypothetical protein